MPINDSLQIHASCRICPLGAHIDHQKGNVTGMAINLGSKLELIPLDEPRIQIVSKQFSEAFDFTFDLASTVRSGWGRYVAGAVCALKRCHPLKYGFKGVLDCCVPSGGLSTSAAVTLTYLLALEVVNHLTVDPWENIAYEQYVENQHIGLSNGILDQAVIMLSRKDHLLHLDCADHKTAFIKLSQGLPQPSIAVIYSGIDKPLENTGYNHRVAECAEAARLLFNAQKKTPDHVPLLRDIDRELFEKFEDRLPLPLMKRARHFFTEQMRVEQGVLAWSRGDLKTFGRLITESGLSSIVNYECGCPELITLYEILCEAPGVLGARFSGAGFRGSCIALCEPGNEDAFRAFVEFRFLNAYPKLKNDFEIFFCSMKDGIRIKGCHL